MPLELPDFDTLKNLAEKDPEALEALRQKHVSSLIESAPAHHQQRLKGLQFQIDAQRKIHTNPLSACIKISQMMHDSFGEMRLLLNSMVDGNISDRTNTKSDDISHSPGQVIQFRGA
ncbi:MAG: DUF3135 domain-containing protein [Cellvibrionaceae bacterium]